jgi:uncharacterized membrane protein YqjE
MEEPAANRGRPAATVRQLALRLLAIWENRVELLMVEVQEDRERLLHDLLLALGVAACGLLAALTLTAALVVLLWAVSPLAVLSVLTCLYGTAGFLLFRRLAARLRAWQMLPASIDQLRKDRAALEKALR